MRPWYSPLEVREATQAAEVLLKGGVVLHPTDSIWGLAANALDREAYKRLVAIKGRPPEKPFLVIVGSLEMLRSLVEVPDELLPLLLQQSRPVTVIYPDACLPEWAKAPDGSVAIRLVRHVFSQALLEQCQIPLFSTSPNRSGAPTPRSFEDIDPTIVEKVDKVVHLPEERKRPGIPSQIVRWRNGQIEIVRP